MTKNRILLLKEYLEENTDEGQSVTTQQIREYLEAHGCPVPVQTLRKDAAVLRCSVNKQDIPAAGVPGSEGGGDPSGSRPDDQQLTASHTHPSQSRNRVRP